MTTPVRVRKQPVPDVVGLPLVTADKVLRQAGFPGAAVLYEESYEPPDHVIGQDPTSGSLLEETSPVRVRVAKQSLLRFLPTVYQPRTPGERSFLRDFLWIFQHLYDSISRRLDTIHELFNPYTTPPDFLPWLASWFAISFDETMDEAHRRRILREAVTLYRIRGTREAIERMVRLFLGLDIEVVENRWPFRGLRIGVSSTIGVDTMVLPEVSMGHTFVVKVSARPEDLGEAVLVRLHRILEAEKPASSNYFLQFSDTEGVTEDTSLWRVGVTSVIGVEQEETTHGG